MVNKFDVPSLWTRQMGQVVAAISGLPQGVTPETHPDGERTGHEAERAFWQQGGPQMARTVDDHIPTPHGDVRVRRYYPVAADEPQPVIVYMHGGGFMDGDLDSHDSVVRGLVHKAQAPAVAIEYTLAPGARHPQQVEECTAVIRHLQAHGREWGLDGQDLTLAGDSAGAFLALASFLHLHETKQHAAIRCLMLFYGTFGLRDSVSWRTMGGPWDGLERKDMEVMLDAFLGDPARMMEPGVDLLSNDLTNDVPPCYIAAAELDPLRDDSRCLAEILNHAGISHRYDEFKGILHGFLHHPSMLDEASIALTNAAEFFHRR